MKKYKIAFDIGGVMTTHTTLIRDLMIVLQNSGSVELFVITDMAQEVAYDQLKKNHFNLDTQHILYADWSKDESCCKEELCREYNIDILFDDHLPYLTALTSTLGCLIVTKNDLLYCSREWRD